MILWFPRAYCQEFRGKQWNASFLDILLCGQVSINKSICLHAQVQWFPFSSSPFWCILTKATQHIALTCPHVPILLFTVSFSLLCIVFSVHLLPVIDNFHSMHTMAPAEINCIWMDTYHNIVLWPESSINRICHNYCRAGLHIRGEVETTARLHPSPRVTSL